MSNDNLYNGSHQGLFVKKLQAIKDRSGMNIRSGHVFMDVKDRDWLFATIENLMGKVRLLEENK